MLRLDEELPPLPDSLQWLDRPPLSLPRGVRDQVVVVLFWRLGCVHGRLALDELALLVERFAGRPVAAIAVHVPVEPAEHDLARLRRAVGGRPVTLAVDARREVRSSLGLGELPHLLLLDARGFVRFSGAGEPRRDRLANAVTTLLRTFDGGGIAAAAPAVAPCAAREPARLIPTGLLATDEGVWVAAAGHHRVYCVGRDGAVLRTVGSGHAGGTDGPSQVASFAAPAGLAAHGDHLVVADPQAHTLRAIDLRDGHVVTWCGAGERGIDRRGGGFGVGQLLAAPTAVASYEGLLYVAQAGTHQLWQFDVDTGAASAWLGAKGRALRDGHDEATFVEPAGLAVAHDSLLVADAGHGALRRVEMAHTFVRTVASGLTRPVAVACRGLAVYVADAWQPAVLVGSENRDLQPWLGAEHGLVEPSALAVVGDDLWIADVGADAIFVVPLQGPIALRRLSLTGFPSVPEPISLAPRAVVCALLRLREFSDVTLALHPALPVGERFDAGAPCTVHVSDEGGGLLACDVHRAETPLDARVEVLVPIAERGEGTLRIRIEAGTRAEVTGLPASRWFDFLVPVVVDASGDLCAEVTASA